MVKNWNHERWRTRDRLLEYDISIMPPRLHLAGLRMVYPWENDNLSMLGREIYQIALNNGYAGEESDFWSHFSSGAIINGTLNTFPVPGNESDLYLDIETNILYYFKITTELVYTDLAARVGIAVAGVSILEDTKTVTHYLYIPVRAMPMENLIFNSGNAAEYID